MSLDAFVVHGAALGEEILRWSYALARHGRAWTMLEAVAICAALAAAIALAGRRWRRHAPPGAARPVLEIDPA